MTIAELVKLVAEMGAVGVLGGISFYLVRALVEGRRRLEDIFRNHLHESTDVQERQVAAQVKNNDLLERLLEEVADLKRAFRGDWK